MAKTKNQLIDEYYEKYFNKLCNSGVQGIGSKLFHKNIENYWKKSHKHLEVLEVGAGVGEHFPFTKFMDTQTVTYHFLDIRKEPENFKQLNHASNAKIAKIWHQASVEDLPFEDESFDRIISTCLFHHISNPLEGFEELRRVLRRGGEFSIGFPTDPSFMNTLIKRVITYPKMRRIGISQPELIYALEHPNKIKGLLEFANHIFKDDKMELHYWPLSFLGVNLNLQVTMKVTKNEK